MGNYRRTVKISERAFEQLKQTEKERDELLALLEDIVNGELELCCPSLEEKRKADAIFATAREAIAKASAEPEQPCTRCNCVKCTTARTAGGTTDAPGYEETNDLLEAATEAMNPVGGE
jgi:hypothetical protein